MVLRGNDGALGPITVDYATSDLTATAGADYQARLRHAGVPGERNGEEPHHSHPPDDADEGDEDLPGDLEQSDGRGQLGTATTTVKILEQLLHGGAAVRFRAGDPARRGREHPHLDRRRTTAKGGPSDGALADAHGRQESVHRSVSGPGHLLPGQTPQAGEPLRPFQLRRPNAHAPRDPAARRTAGSGQTEEDYMQFRPWRKREGFSTAIPTARSTRSGQPVLERHRCAMLRLLVTPASMMPAICGV